MLSQSCETGNVYTAAAGFSEAFRGCLRSDEPCPNRPLAPNTGGARAFKAPQYWGVGGRVQSVGYFSDILSRQFLSAEFSWLD